MGRKNKIVLNRREREKQQRINSILDAALRVFAEKGFYSARMEDIAEKAEFGKGTLYYYFKTKEELYLELLKREEEKLTRELEDLSYEKDTPEELTQKLIKFFTEYFAKNKEYIAILFPLQSGFVSFKDLTLVNELEKLKKNFRHIPTIKKMLKEVIDKNCIETATSTDDLLYFLGIMIRGMGDFIRVGEEKKVKDSLISIVKKLKICEDQQ